MVTGIWLRFAAVLLILPVAFMMGGTAGRLHAQSDPTLREAAAAAKFFMGAAVEPFPIQSDPAYADVLRREFNSLTPENRLKWRQIHPERDSYVFSPADELVDFADQHGMRVRGHTLLWADPAFIPDYVNAAASPAELHDILEEHITAVAGRYAGRLAQWDVVNEPLEAFGTGLRDNVFLDLLGPGYVAEAFHLAHATDPGAQLFLNEFFLDYNGAKAQAFLDLVQGLLAEGVPIDGVGVQAHFFGLAPNPLPPREEFQGFLQALADLGVAVELTELDISITYFLADPDPPARQAAYFGEIVGACMAVPACTGVTTWGIHDGETWLDTFPPFDQFGPHRPLLFDEALQPKPAYLGVRDALLARVPPPTPSPVGGIGVLPRTGSGLDSPDRGLSPTAALAIAAAVVALFGLGWHIRKRLLR